MQESLNRSRYRQIFKATGIFGGVQIVNILINIVRSKFTAVLLGPAGMGIIGLLSSTTTFVSYLTNFGLGTSAVKNVAEANSSSDDNRIALVIKVVHRWVWITGILGTIVIIIFAGLLSQITFGNHDYTTAFLILSVTMLFNQISNGQLVVLQGLRKVKYLANASVTGSMLGLIISIPIYYRWGIKGVVPAIVISSFVLMLRAWYFANKVKINQVDVSLVQTYSEGKKMLVMGIVISLTSAISLGAAYLLRIAINHFGTIEQVGLFSAGFVILNTYVGLVFNAMGTDYFPRLSSVAADNEKVIEVVNQQAEMAILIIGPILAFFIVFIDWIIIALYSSKFVKVNEMLHWAALGIFFKAASWSISYIFLAKSESRVFFWNELITNLYLIAFNIFGYYFYGLMGLGISFLIVYAIYLLQVYSVCRSRYHFIFHKEFVIILSIQIFISTICLILIKLIIVPYSYFLCVPLICLSGLYSISELDKRIGIKQVFARFLKK